MVKNISVAGPSITDHELNYVIDAVKNAWYGDHNIYHERFEKAFANTIGTRHAMALPSCTSALHLSLAALGIGPGDEVIVPDITWIASSAPVTYVGAKPVFVDIDPGTWCISEEAFEQAITTRTKAAIIVDLYGGMPNWEKLIAIANSNKISLIEDAAEAVGSSYQGKMAGSLGVFGTFSFHGSKTMTTGEGGMLVTDSSELFERAQFLRDHGRPLGDKLFQNKEVAFKYKMSSMQAAMGLAQTERLGDLVKRKREIFDWYKIGLSGLDEITLNHESDGDINSYWMVTAVFDSELKINKFEIIDSLAQKNIDSRPFFDPLSSLDAYQDLLPKCNYRELNKVSYSISSRAINLPSGLNLNQKLVNEVCDVLRTIVNKKRKYKRQTTH